MDTSDTTEDSSSSLQYSSTPATASIMLAVFISVAFGLGLLSWVMLAVE